MNGSKRKLLLKNFQSPGDIVMLTAAVRDLQKCYRGSFFTDVRSSCPELWFHNPYLTPLSEDDPEVESIECHYPLIHASNRRPYHFVQGFTEYLNQKLELKIRPTAFRGDVYLSQDEKASPSPVAEMGDSSKPYWVIVAGGKTDFTIKMWDPERYQEVVDHFRETLTFVQVGETHHLHPELKGVIDLRGKTSVRDLIRLIYHADGVLCPVTFAMHLAAAIEKPKKGRATVARA